MIAFIQVLSDLGWKNAKNVQMETCWGAGDTGRFHQCAAEIVALAPDVILAADAVRPVSGLFCGHDRGGPIKVVFTSRGRSSRLNHAVRACWA